VWSEARRPNTEAPVALQPQGEVREKILESYEFVVMEKAAPFSEFAGCEGELKKSVSVQNIALFC